jgi:lysozyme family protein
MNFTAVRAAYLADAWNRMVITRKRDDMEKDASKIIAKKAIYQDVEKTTGVPWWLIAVIDMREGGISRLGTRHLHNGDLLSNYTIHVPAGRPKVGHGPPFTWRESAIDSIKFQGLDKITRWTIERALHVLEAYNGFAYANKGRPSPYNWSCCSIYDPPTGPGGKILVDHGAIDNNVIDPQYGCAPFIFVLAELDSSVRIHRESEVTSGLVVNKTDKNIVKGGAAIATGGVAGGAVAAAGFGWVGVVMVVIVAIVVFGIIFMRSR